jgi:hypothetical protein
MRAWLGAIILLFLLLLSSAFAWEREFFWEGQIKAGAEKTVLNAGETLKLDIEIENLSDAPLADAYLVFQLVHITPGPDILFQRENIIAEKTISEHYNLRGKESKIVKAEITVPAYAPAGQYRLDIYLKNPRSYVVGVPDIFVYPYSIDLEVKNSGKQRNVAIDRKNTVICGPLSELQFKLDCYSGPVGVIVEPEKEITINVAVKNNSLVDEKNLKLRIAFYHYDDTLLEAPVKEFTINIEKIPKKSTWEKDVNVVTPAKPGAYPIKLEVFDSEGNLLSVFRHRVNVRGMSSRFVFVYPDRIYYERGSKAKVVVKFLSPSDASTEGLATIKAYIKKDGKELYSKSKEIVLKQNLPIRTEEFSFDISEELQDFIVGAELVDSSNNVLDSYEQAYYYEEFSKSLASLEIETSAEQSFAKPSERFFLNAPIYVRVKAIDERGIPTEVDATLYIRDDNINLGPFALKNTYEIEQPLKEGTYTLVCEAYNKVAEKAIVIEAPKELVVKSYGSESYSEEKTEFTEGSAIYFEAYLLDYSNKRHEAPIQYFITGNGYVLGPFTFSGRTMFEKYLPAGNYVAEFSSLGLKKTIEIVVIPKSAEEVPVTETPPIGETPVEKTPEPSLVHAANPLFGAIAAGILFVLIGLIIIYLRKKLF